MAFVQIEKTAGAGRKVASVSVRGASPKWSATQFCISSDIAERIGLSEGGAAKIMVGSESDTGKIAVMATCDTRAGYKIRRQHAGAQKLINVTIPGYTPPARITPAEFQIVDDALIVTLPQKD